MMCSSFSSSPSTSSSASAGAKVENGPCRVYPCLRGGYLGCCGVPQLLLGVFLLTRGLPPCLPPRSFRRRCIPCGLGPIRACVVLGKSVRVRVAWRIVLRRARSFGPLRVDMLLTFSVVHWTVSPGDVRGVRSVHLWTLTRQYYSTYLRVGGVGGHPGLLSGFCDGVLFTLQLLSSD